MADAFDSLLFVGGDDISDAMAFRSIQLFLVWLPLFLVRPLRKRASKKSGLTPVWNICKMHVFYPDWPVLIPASAFLISSHNNYAVNFRISMSALQALLIPRLLLYYGSDSTHLSGKAWTVSSSACSADNYLKIAGCHQSILRRKPTGSRYTGPKKFDTLLDDAQSPDQY